MAKKKRKNQKKEARPKDAPKEKDIEAPKKRRISLLEKEIRWGIVIASVAAVIAIIVLVMLGFKIRFMIGDELIIGVDKLDHSFSIRNDEGVNLTVRVANHNFGQCSASCDFALVDLSDNSVISNSTYVLRHNQETALGYRIDAPGKGRGQDLYNFKATCHNVKSVLCLTDGTSRYKTVLVSVNYDLSDEEKEIILRLKPRLDEIVALNQNVSYALAQSELLLDMYTWEDEGIFADLGSIRQDYDPAKSEVRTLTSLWDSRDYKGLDRAYSDSLISRLAALNSSVSALKEEIISDYSFREKSVALILALDKAKVSEVIYYYANETNNNSFYTASQLYEATGTLSVMYHALLEGSVFSQAEIYKATWLSSDIIRNISDDYLDTRSRAGSLKGSFLVQASLINLTYDITGKTFCDEIRSISPKIASINSLAQDYRKDNFNQTLNDTSFDLILSEASLILGNATSETLSDGSSDQKLATILGSNKENISYAEMKKMVQINAGPYEDFILANCRSQSQININSQDMLSSIDGIDTAKITMLPLEIPVPNITAEVLSGNSPRCCTYGTCKDCCDSCGSVPYPVLFIHGHAVNKQLTPEASMKSFAKIQEKMEKDGFIDAGELDVGLNTQQAIFGEWERSGRPVTVRATYYLINQYELGNYYVVTQKSERIENYAIRLKEIIDLLKYRTGAEKVDVVAHSMGGLVLREYIALFGDDDINKAILINSPNHGITGSVNRFCGVLGADKECEDMSEGSTFLNRLNSRTVPDNIYVIRSEGCDTAGMPGDGVVTSQSVYLPGAHNYLVNGTCTDTLKNDLHGAVLDPDKYPEVYDMILGIVR